MVGCKQRKADWSGHGALWLTLSLIMYSDSLPSPCLQLSDIPLFSHSLSHPISVSSFSASQYSSGFDSSPLLSSQHAHCVSVVIKPAIFCAIYFEKLSQMRLKEHKNPTATFHFSTSKHLRHWENNWLIFILASICVIHSALLMVFQSQGLEIFSVCRRTY